MATGTHKRQAARDPRCLVHEDWADLRSYADKCDLEIKDKISSCEHRIELLEQRLEKLDEKGKMDTQAAFDIADKIQKMTNAVEYLQTLLTTD